MNKCTEIVIYSIKPEKINEFINIKEQLLSEAKTLTGLLTTSTTKSINSKNVYLDQMQWKSADHANNGFDDFLKLPSTAQFMELMTGPPIFSDRFEEL